MNEKMYIGRTEAYYEGDNDSVFAPDYWTYSDNPNDLAGEVHELTEEGIHELEWWLECCRMNEWQRNHSFGFRNERPEQMWEILTNPENGYSNIVL